MSEVAASCGGGFNNSYGEDSSTCNDEIWELADHVNRDRALSDNAIPKLRSCFTPHRTGEECDTIRCMDTSFVVEGWYDATNEGITVVGFEEGDALGNNDSSSDRHDEGIREGIKMILLMAVQLLEPMTVIKLDQK